MYALREMGEFQVCRVQACGGTRGCRGGTMHVGPGGRRGWGMAQVGSIEKASDFYYFRYLIYGITQILCFFDWVVSLSIMSSCCV